MTNRLSGTASDRGAETRTQASLSRSFTWAALALFASTCALTSAEAKGRSSSLESLSSLGEAQSAPAQATSLDFDAREDGTVIGLSANGPLLNHTAYQLSDEVLIVELQGVDGAELPPEAEMGTSEVAGIRTTVEKTPSGVKTRLEIHRSAGARATLAADPRSPNRLLITVPSSGSFSAPAQMQQVVAPPTRTASKPRAAAPERTELNEMFESNTAVAPEPAMRSDLTPRGLAESAPSAPVKITSADVSTAADGRIVLTLQGTGPLQHEVFRIDESPARLVVDLKHAVTAVSRGVIPVSEAGVRRVRIRQNQPTPNPVVRVVVDLDDAGARHELMPGPSSLVVLVGAPRALAPSRRTQGAAPRMASARDTTSFQSASAPQEHPAWAARDAAKVATASTGAQSSGMSATPASLVTSPAYADLGRPFATQSDAAPPTFGQALPAGQEMREAAPSAGAMISGGAEKAASFTTGGNPDFSTKELASDVKIYTGEPISMDFKDADLQDLFRLFADITEMNIIVDPSVAGKNITLVVNDVPWDQVMDLVLKTNGLGSVLDGNVLRIAPLQQLAREETQKKALADAQELAQERSTIVRTLSYAQGTAAQSIVNKRLSARGDAQLDKRTNTLIVREIHTRMPEIENLIDILDRPTRQVMIETRIVETTRDFSKSIGIQWGFGYIADRAFGNSTGFSFPRSIAADYAVNLPTLSSTSVLGLSFRNILNTFTLDMAISAAEQRGRARIISTPRVMVQNNEEAFIESGVQIPVETTTATEIDVTFVSASLRLTVTPQITEEDTVIMRVKIENNQPVFFSTTGDTPSIATRQAETVVAVPDGGTTIIGGIYQVNEGATQGRVPFFSRIPLLGWLFRNKTQDRTNDELIIFLTPSIQKT